VRCSGAGVARLLNSGIVKPLVEHAVQHCARTAASGRAYRFELQTISKIRIHSNNALNNGVGLWRSVIVDFSTDGITFGNTLSYMTSDTEAADKTARFIDVPVRNIPARFVRLRFDHRSEWIFISEIVFE
jgi:hypothetical protein